MTGRARPLECLETWADADPVKLRALAQQIDQGLARIYRLANQRVSPATVTKPRVDAARPVDAQNAPTRSLGKPHRTRFPTAPTRLFIFSTFGNRTSGATMSRPVTVTYGLTGPESGPTGHR